MSRQSVATRAASNKKGTREAEIRVTARHEKNGSELLDLICLYISCDDCGHVRRWSRMRLDEAERQGYRRLPTLGSKFRCVRCSERGGSGRNISLRPVLKETGDGER